MYRSPADVMPRLCSVRQGDIINRFFDSLPSPAEKPGGESAARCECNSQVACISTQRARIRGDPHGENRSTAPWRLRAGVRPFSACSGVGGLSVLCVVLALAKAERP